MKLALLDRWRPYPIGSRETATPTRHRRGRPHHAEAVERILKMLALHEAYRATTMSELPRKPNPGRPRRVTIVMYHFVRDLARSRYPRIAGLDSGDFAGQLDYIRRHYNVVRMEDVVAAAHDPDLALPERALLLTFDDGYADHFDIVFPLLLRHGLQGSFFPPARAILERRVLDINKIHFVLAAEPNTTLIVAALEDRITASGREHGTETVAHYRATYAHANRWDTAEVIYLKRMLQKGLPSPLRTAITDALFREFVTTNETAFADELYVTQDQLRHMLANGMHVGGHGLDHVWLDSLDGDTQEREVLASKDFLAAIGSDLDAWVMCYPFGAFDASLLSILERHGCRGGLTTEVAIADLDTHHPLTLPRIDTNDLPRRANAPVNRWTVAGVTRAHGGGAKGDD